jgi:hypothetical protein
MGPVVQTWLCENPTIVTEQSFLEWDNDYYTDANINTTTGVFEVEQH